MQQLMDRLFALSADIRYVAIYQDDVLTASTKPGVTGASASESDRFEELLVNPTILTLVTQRGNIDCGGAQFVLIRYGHFYQYVAPLEHGHVSVAIEPTSDALQLVGVIRGVLSGEDDDGKQVFDTSGNST
jgi:hypothetical protein